MVRYAFRIYVTTLIAYAVGRINLILVNSYLGASAAGQYSVGLAVSDGLHLLPSVVALNLFPRIARGEGDERSAEVFRTPRPRLWGAVSPDHGAARRPGLRLLYGPAFSPAVDIYYWMLLGIWAYGLINVLAYHFAGKGFPREAMLVWIPGLALNLVLVFALVPSGSAWMAALPATLAYMLILVLHMRMFAREVMATVSSCRAHGRPGLSASLWSVHCALDRLLTERRRVRCAPGQTHLTRSGILGGCASSETSKRYTRPTTILGASGMRTRRGTTSTSNAFSSRSHRRGSALELGCGFGALLARLHGEFERLVGVDISDAAVQRGRERFPFIEFMHGSLADPAGGAPRRGDVRHDHRVRCPLLPAGTRPSGGARMDRGASVAPRDWRSLPGGRRGSLPVRRRSFATSSSASSRSSARRSCTPDTRCSAHGRGAPSLR